MSAPRLTPVDKDILSWDSATTTVPIASGLAANHVVVLVEHAILDEDTARRLEIHAVRIIAAGAHIQTS